MTSNDMLLCSSISALFNHHQRNSFLYQIFVSSDQIQRSAAKNYTESERPWNTSKNLPHQSLGNPLEELTEKV